MKSHVVINTIPCSDVEIDFNSIPEHDKNRMCKVLVSAIEKFFQNPEIREDFEKWKKEKEQTA